MTSGKRYPLYEAFGDLLQKLSLIDYTTDEIEVTVSPQVFNRLSSELTDKRFLTEREAHITFRTDTLQAHYPEGIVKVRKAKVTGNHYFTTRK